MAKYHLRRVDREIKDQELIDLILGSATHMNLAMTDGNEPYIVPLNYVYEPSQRVIYFHGAKEGKKREILRRNPRVWGSAVIDHGFTEGQCENLYASVVFSGEASFVEDQEAKLMVLRMQIDKQSEEDGKKAIQAAFSGHHSCKHVFVVDKDIDIYNPMEVEWAMATRFQGERDMVISTKLGFDLTKPLTSDGKAFDRALFPQVDIEKYLKP